MGQFPISNRYEYIIMVIDYMSRWVKAIPLKTNYHTIILTVTQQNIFSRFGSPRAIISDGGHILIFINFVPF